MCPLKIFFADDQILDNEMLPNYRPDMSDTEVKEALTEKYPTWGESYINAVVGMRGVVSGLQGAGYEVIYQTSFAKALKAIQNQRFKPQNTSWDPDVAIIDMGWPFDPGVPRGSDRMQAGYDLARAIVEANKTRSRPIKQILYSSRLVPKAERNEEDYPSELLDAERLAEGAAKHGMLPVYKDYSPLDLTKLLAILQFIEQDEVNNADPVRNMINELQRQVHEGFVLLNKWQERALASGLILLAAVAVVAVVVIISNQSLDVVIALNTLLTAAIGAYLWQRLTVINKTLRETRDKLLDFLNKRFPLP
jgi:hypothetical protein